MSTLMMDLETRLCKARGIVRVVMENIGAGNDSREDTEYALWAVSDLLSEAIDQCTEPPEWPVLGEDELAVQDGGGIVHFDRLFPEEVPDEPEGPELRVTPDGTVVTTTTSPTHKELF